MSTRDALVPALKALRTDTLFQHTDVNVQMLLASCMNELIRITTPIRPYPDDIMKEIFQLFMIALKQLSYEYNINYSRAWKIIQAMAEVRSCLILLNIDSEAMVVEMFQLFFNIVWSNHSSDVIKFMETIMTLMIEESDEISLELLRPLLASVRMDNKNISPFSWELGKTVFERCATKLQPYLRDAVKPMNLNVDDYAEIVTSLCQDASNEKNMLAEEVAATVQSVAVGLSGDGVSKVDGISEAEQEVAAPQMKDGNANTLDDEISSEPLNCSHQIMQIQSNNGRSDGEAMNDAEIVQPESDTGARRRRRGRIPSSLIRPEEWYVDPWITRGKYYDEVSSDGNNEEKKDLASASQLESKDVVDKTVGYPMSNPAEAKYPRGLAPAKEKKLRRPRDDYGEELVNLKIQVWWPMDKTFYTGTVEAFDPLTKKHTIKYDDDEQEILDLRKERWELFSDEQPRQTQTSQKQEADNRSPAKEPDKTQKKIAKRKAGSSKKQLAVSSSKRSKTVTSSLVKSGDYATGLIDLNVVPDDETNKANFSSKDDGENDADKEPSLETSQDESK